MAGRTANDRAEARDQFFRLEGLGQVVVGAGVDAGDALGPGAARRQHQDRRRHAGGAQLAHHRQAVEPRQAEVENDPVEVFRSGARPGFLAVGAGLHDIAGLSQMGADLGGDLRFVFDHERAHQ